MLERTKLIQELIHDEGERFGAYRDSLGLWTIGVGHLLGNTQRMIEITPAESRALLLVDIDAAEKVVSGLLPNWRSDYDPTRQRALVNMAFNLGNRLATFHKFLGHLRNGKDYVLAVQEMHNSTWAKQVGDRAIRLADMILFGEDKNGY